MRETKAQFIERRLDYHKALLKEKYDDIPDSALAFWAEDAAEKEWRNGRVYSDPVAVQCTEISVYDTTQKFASGRAAGISLRFSPAGPMVSVMSLSYAEAAELAEAIVYALQDLGEDRLTTLALPDPS
jgi:hypothetical protein